MKEKQNVLLTKENIHYCKNVLRMKINEKIKIVNNTNCVFTGKITKIENNSIHVYIEKKEKKNLESSIKIHLAPIILNQKKMNFVIQKSTELGVNSITPLLPTNYHKKNDNNELSIKQKRWTKIAISSCLQCKRNIVPKINFPERINLWCKKINVNELNLIFDPCAKKKISSLKLFQKKINIIIGSESGFSKKEIENLKKKYGFINVSLGKRTLRSETSSIAAVAILLYKYEKE
ncbi:16S rRNA (uracil(1498)-N(3))-methyltransferase [Buchnera aphidicola (Mindarus keteleerifoliae)]|uniref:16S rRNA (uracil(1498)-N(3))-methyltransferase n=1 Tax=Buchnera aphidicola TaxID=9 RepID=UPI0031B735EF